MGFVTDEIHHVFGLSGTPSQVADQIRRRNDFAARSTMVLYNEAGPDAVTDIVRGLKGAGD